MLKSSHSQPALSLIEVMVAVVIVSFVLIALVSNIFYTQRVIIDARLRANALDQANSCLERFRNLRDGMHWWEFYRRTYCHCGGLSDCRPTQTTFYLGKTGQSNTPLYVDEIMCEFPFTIPAYDILNRPAGKYADNPRPSFWHDFEGKLPALQKWEGTRIQKINDTICGQPPADLAANNFGYHGDYQVKLDFNPSPTGQKITVTVKVQYQDYRGKDKQVEVSQQFAQDVNSELPFKITPSP